MVLGKYSRTAKLALKRVGQETTILRESGGTENGYGKTDDSWNDPETVGTWYAHMSYNYRSDRPEQNYTGTGERDEDTPVFLFPKEADLENGDRVTQGGLTFEITADPVEYPTHYVARSQKVRDNGQD